MGGVASYVAGVDFKWTQCQISQHGGYLYILYVKTGTVIS